ncbi:hypothetical protein T11_8799 [Trichinella zimbabwensis]|uniref:Uncharacterized protein n=1 Tax=Trichinella zimbabwensis TaxID=268475 RepID=A0A0V1GVN2_9BILA|nr:hypothetical protein T11_8799 [Trichinella zimbabwensis]
MVSFVKDEWLRPRWHWRSVRISAWTSFSLAFFMASLEISLRPRQFLALSIRDRCRPATALDTASSLVAILERPSPTRDAYCVARRFSPKPPSFRGRYRSIANY